jgi:glycine hydroxymethyltransferase
MALSAPWASAQAQSRLHEIQAASSAGSAQELRRIAEAAAAHRRMMDEEGLVLYAGTNAPAPGVTAVHDTQLGMRPSMGLPGEKAQHGLEHLEVIEVLTARTVAATFRASYADVRIQSGTLANLAVYAAVAEVGAPLAALPEWAGGHVSHTEAGVAGLRGHRVLELPYDAQAMDVDLDALCSFVLEQRPALIVVGASLFLFPHRLQAISSIAHRFGSTVLYDASHVAGLIAGGCFQDPLAEGADVVTFSTYKSYGGPPGGAILTNDHDLAARIATQVFPRLTANFDAGRLHGLCIAANALLVGGSEYACQCIATARALAQALSNHGLPIIGADRGFTDSHHLAVKIGDTSTAEDVTERLAQAGIYLSWTLAPAPDGPVPVLRIGTQELVRRGFHSHDMEFVAELVVRVIAGESPAKVKVAARDLRTSAPPRGSYHGQPAA